VKEPPVRQPIYTYAFLPTPTTSLNLPVGIAGELALIRHDAIAAVTEPELDFTAVETDDSRLLEAAIAHDLVMRDIFERTPLLPLQFGTRFQSQIALVAHLAAQQATYLDKLASLAGYVEYCCKLTPRQPSSCSHPEIPAVADWSSPTPAQVDWQQETEKQDILQRISQSYPQSIVSAAPESRVKRAYLLVPRQDAFKLEEQVFRWCTQLSRWQLELGQPLPPYHFV
jgi:hypothetical protein